MKTIRGLLLVILVMGVGCVQMPVPWEKPKPPPAVKPEKKPATQASPVRPEQVNESNAAQKAEALERELDAEGAD